MSIPRRRLATAGRLVLWLACGLFAARGASAATLRGRVADPNGRPVMGARVVVADAIGTAADRTTDANGDFSVEYIAAGRYEIRVLADGLQADPITITLTTDETREVRVPLRVSALTESIVVSAAQIDVPLSRAADSVTVITAADLRSHQIETVADALRLVPGLAVVRSGGRGAITSLFPRGGASNYTLVLIDGVRANSFGGGYDFAHLSVAGVDRIEIVRGPESALFGADAIGAVVQIVTRRGGPPRVEGLVESGSQDTRRTTIAATGSHGGWSFGGSAEHSRSDGFTGLAPANGERVSNDDDHLSHASGTLGWQRAGGPDLFVTTNITHDERGFPGPFGANPIGVFGGVDRVSRGVNDTRQIGARVTHPWSSRARQRIEAGYSDLSGDFTSPFGPSTSGTRRFDGRVQEDAAFTPWLGGSAGVELLRERGSSSFITGASDEPLPIRRAIVGSFAELRYAGRERLFVAGGLRVEHISRDALEPSASRPAFPEETINSVNPKIAASYLVTPNGARLSTRLRASAGTGIRPPDAFEIAFTDNPHLKPERSRSFDLAIEQQFAGGAYALAATAFFNEYNDLIVAIRGVLGDASRYKTDNVSNARARGLELSGDARLGMLKVRANYTFLATDILSVDGLARIAPPPFRVGDPLIRRPRHQGAIDLTYIARRFTAFGEVTTRARVLDVEPNFGASSGLFFSPGYSIVNTGVSVRLVRGIDVYARVLNLANRAYEEALGYPGLGRSTMAGIRVAANR